MRGSYGQLLAAPPGGVAFVACWIEVPQIPPDVFKGE